MPSILLNESASLKAENFGNIEPADGCTSWGGWYTVGMTKGVALPISQYIGMGAPSYGIPYVYSPNNACSIPDSNSGGLTGTFYPNGFVGTVDIYITVTDAVGAVSTSPSLTYNCITPSSLSVNAYPDSASTSSYSLSSGVTGGTPPYTYVWNVEAAPVGATPVLSSSSVPAPSVSGLTKNGYYSFTLDVQDSNGLTGSDFSSITRTGAAATLSATYTPVGGTAITRTKSFTIIPSGGVPPYAVSPDALGPGWTCTPMSDLSSPYNFTLTWPATVAEQVYLSQDFAIEDSSFPANSTILTVNWWFECFLPGTILTKEDGTPVAIENLKAGDKIYSTGIVAYEEFVYEYSSANPDLSLKISNVKAIRTLSNTNYISVNDDLLKVTNEHPIFVYDSETTLYSFKRAGDLLVGDNLVGLDGVLTPITSVEAKENPDGIVYTIDTDHWNTYIANGLIVHNIACGANPP